MCALMKKNLRIWGYGKVLALFAGCLIFSIGGRYGDSISYELHILAAASDHYYLTYFMLPIVLLSCFSFLEDDDEQTMIRFGSYYGYFTKKWLGVGAIAVILVCTQTIAILLSGAGLELSNSWQLAQGSINKELFHVLQRCFSTPSYAFAAVTLYQLLGTWFTFGICLWIGHFTSRKWSIGILIAAYVVSALWIKIPVLQRIPLTSLNHWMILHHNLPDRFVVTGITSVLLFLLMMASLRFSGHIQLSRLRNGITVYYLRELMSKSNLLILCTVVVGIVLYKGLANSQLTSGEEWICTLFAGHGTGYFHVLSFLEMLIVNTAPLYLLAAFVERTISRQSIFVSIRAKGLHRLFAGLMTASIVFLAIYGVLWLVGGVLGGIALGYSVSIDMGKLLISEVCLKFLDTLVQYLVMMSVYLFTKQITVGFLVLIAGNILSIVPVHWVEYFPFGLSSTARLDLFGLGVGIPLTEAIEVTGTCALVIGIWLAAFGYRKLNR